LKTLGRTWKILLLELDGNLKEAIRLSKLSFAANNTVFKIIKVSIQPILLSLYLRSHFQMGH